MPEEGEAPVKPGGIKEVWSGVQKKVADLNYRAAEGFRGAQQKVADINVRAERLFDEKTQQASAKLGPPLARVTQKLGEKAGEAVSALVLEPKEKKPQLVAARETQQAPKKVEAKITPQEAIAQIRDGTRPLEEILKEALSPQEHAPQIATLVSVLLVKGQLPNSATDQLEPLLANITPVQLERLLGRSSELVNRVYNRVEINRRSGLKGNNLEIARILFQQRSLTKAEFWMAKLLFPPKKLGRPQPLPEGELQEAIKTLLEYFQLSGTKVKARPIPTTSRPTGRETSPAPPTSTPTPVPA